MVKKKSLPKEEKLIGKITHYFDKLEVAVIKLTGALKVGDEIHVIGGEVDFTQKVKDMQIDHKSVKSAKAKNAIGLKIEEKAREGYRVFKI